MKTFNIIFRVTESVGNSCLGMRKILSVTDFTTQFEAEQILKAPKNKSINVNIPYQALTKIENGCVHTCIGFYQ